MKATEFKIPEGFALVPVQWIEQFFTKAVWTGIEVPTIDEAANHAGVSVQKIKKDFKKYDCHLREVNSGKAGRGNKKTFTKQSVENYKKWI